MTALRSDEDFAEEVRAHIQIETDRLIDEGRSPHEARTLAERRFGNVTRVRETFYESRRILWLDHLSQDVRSAVRNVAKYPVAAAVAVLSLAFGIGATTATLMVRDAVFYRPPKLYATPDQISRVVMSYPDRARALVPGRIYSLWSQDRELAPGLAAAVPQRPREVRTADHKENAPVSPVTPELFSVLGVRAALGSTFDGMPPESAQQPAVISNAVWRRVFESDPHVVGTSIWIDGSPYVVIGVMPRAFWFASMEGAIWTRATPAELQTTPDLWIVCRRPADLTPAALADRLQRAADPVAGELLGDQRELRVRTTTIAGTPIGDNVGPWAVILLGMAVFLTLLIACTNVAMLMIAQWTIREHETAIRAALGGGRARLIVSLLTESMVIAAAGGALGIAATYGLAGVITRNGDGAGMFNLSLDPWTFIEALLVTVTAGIGTGLAPAIYETRRIQVNPLNTLRTSDRVRQRWRHALVVFEIATTVALLVVTGAIISATQRSLAAELGFSTHPLMTIGVENSQGIPVARVIERLRTMDGVVSVSAATSIPLSAYGGASARIVADAKGAELFGAERVEMTADFFSTLGVSLLSGRTFADLDVATGHRVTILNEAAASTAFPDGGAFGKALLINGEPYTVVGIVANYSQSQLGHPVPSFFVPLQKNPSRVAMLVKTTTSPAPLLQTARRLVNDVGDGTTATSAMTMDQIIAVGSKEILATAVPLTPLNFTAMMLTTAGIYGVLAFSITRRSAELAVRLALGASKVDLVKLIARQSVQLVVIGSLLGVAATWALTRVAQGRGGIFDSPGMAAFVVPVLVMLVVGLVATWVPLRRAFRINPATLLRAT